VGSNPIGSTAKLPANDQEIENYGRHAEGAVQQPCRNPSKSPEILENASVQKYGGLPL